MTATASSRARPRPSARSTRQPARISGGTRGLLRAEDLRQPRSGAAAPQSEPGINWTIVAYMGALHALAIVALLPRFWSLPAVGSFLVLYWVTACLGVTVGYHRLLSHRSFRVPHWLERFFTTCGALSCQHGPID
jgi:stearoyl-CoA desaturase (delta-9 desaturase)